MAALLCAAVVGSAGGQSYPAKPVRLVVPYPRAAALISSARPIAQALGDKLGQSVVVDNRGGATGMIGTDIVVKSPADGYTPC